MGRDHSCEGCGNGGLNNDEPCVCGVFDAGHLCGCGYCNEPFLPRGVVCISGRLEHAYRAGFMEGEQQGRRAGQQEMRTELEATNRALYRWQHGQQIEGDYIDRDGVVVPDLAEEMRGPLEALVAILPEDTNAGQIAREALGRNGQKGNDDG